MFTNTQRSRRTKVQPDGRKLFWDRCPLMVEDLEGRLLLSDCQTPSSLFLSAGQYPTAGGTHSVTFGDLDHDGDLDMVVANASASRVSVLPGNGDGTFASRTDYAVGGYAVSIRLGDFDRDGHLDVVTANRLGNSVSVLMGNGDGSFASRSDYATAEGTNGVAIGDLDGDGDLDIVTGNLADNVSVLLGNGDGTFGARADWSTGDGPASITLGDMDSDGDLDVLVANRHESTMSVLLGDGHGAFPARAEYVTGAGPTSIAVGDVDRNGTLDVVTANAFAPGASILFGNGDGTLGTRTDLITTHGEISPVGLADIDADSKLDLVLGNHLAGSITVRLGNGDGTFAAGVEYATGDGPVSIAFGDFDTDGDVDIAVGNAFSSNVSVFLNVLADPANIVPTACVLGPTEGVRGQMLTFEVNVIDSLTDEAAGFTYFITWGDGSSQTINRTPGNGNGTLISHAYVESGSFTLSLTATDQNGDLSEEVNRAITISPVGIQVDPCDPSQTVLAIGGTTGNDSIFVGPAGNSGDVRITINGSEFATFHPTGHIIVFGQAGDDNIQLVESITVSAIVHGDAGNDRIKGGSGHDILIGGEGDDLLVGGNGRDLLIGGIGSDRIVGNPDDDILIAGTTDYDNNEQALCDIMKEWTRADAGYATRVGHLRGDAGAGTGLNGSILLVSEGTGATVHDDAAADVLTGSAGSDWFLLNLDGEVKDKVTDLSAQEFANDLDFISAP